MGDAFCALNAFAETLQPHCMIKLYNDDSATSCHLPRGLIEKASYFLVIAVKEPDDAPGNPCIHIPNSNDEAFLLLVHYIVMGTLSSDFHTEDSSLRSSQNSYGDLSEDLKITPKHQLALAYAWLLGARYQMPQFQDLVMKALLDTPCDVGLGTIRQVCEASCESKLWYLCLQRLAMGMRMGDFGYSELEHFARVPHFWEDWVVAQENCERDEMDGDNSKEYMVSEGVSEPWGQYG